MSRDWSLRKKQDAPVIFFVVKGSRLSCQQIGRHHRRPASQISLRNAFASAGVRNVMISGVTTSTTAAGELIIEHYIIVAY
jgi:hypothetical protein